MVEQVKASGLELIPNSCRIWQKVFIYGVQGSLHFFSTKKHLVCNRSHFHFAVFFFYMPVLYLFLIFLLPSSMHKQLAAPVVRIFQSNEHLKHCPLLLPVLYVSLHGDSVLPVLSVFQASQLLGGHASSSPHVPACGSSTDLLPYPVLTSLIQYSPFVSLPFLLKIRRLPNTLVLFWLCCFILYPGPWLTFVSTHFPPVVWEATYTSV